MTRTHAVAAAFMAAALVAVPAQAQTLKPYQQAALEKLLAQTDPAVRAMAEPQYRQMLSSLNEAQVKTMLSAMAQNQADADADNQQEVETEAAAEPADAEASAEDLAANAAQYKPVIRKSWEARRAWDAFIAGKNEALKGQSHYAVFGSGWGYDLTPFLIREEPTTDNFQLYDSTFSHYAPTDGRYRFNFSGVRTGYDTAKIDSILAKAQRDYDALGKAFVSEAKKLSDAKNFDAIFKYYQTCNAKVAAILDRMNSAISAEAPTDGTALATVLLGGERVD